MADFNNVKFVGTLGLGKETEKFKPYQQIDNGQGWVGKRISFNIKADKNMQFLELIGGHKTDGSSEIYSFTKSTKNDKGEMVKGEKINVKWEDRNKPEIIEKIANFKKIIIDLDSPNRRFDLQKKLEKLNDKSTPDEKINDIIEDTINTYEYNETKGDIKEYLADLLDKSNKKKKEFLAEEDAVEFLNTMIPKVEGKVFVVEGSWDFSEYKGKIQQKFKPNHIYLSKDQTEKQKCRGEITVYFNKESLDDSIFKESKKYLVNCYISAYDRRVKKEVFYPTTLTIDGSKVDFEDEKQIKRLDFLKKIFEVRGRKYYKVRLNTMLLNGSEKQELTLNDLTDFEREQVELGFTTLEEIQKDNGQSYGDKTTETKVVSLHKDSRKTGAIETELKDEDFVLVTTEDEKLEDLTKENEEKNNKAVDDIFNAEDDEDLFG